MAKYRKKPVVIEAEQYVSASRFCHGYSQERKAVLGVCQSHNCLVAGLQPHVHTINDQIVILEVGDWIIPEPDGEHFYPCKPDIFEASYEEVIDTTN